MRNTTGLSIQNTVAHSRRQKRHVNMTWYCWHICYHKSRIRVESLEVHVQTLAVVHDMKQYSKHKLQISAKCNQMSHSFWLSDQEIFYNFIVMIWIKLCFHFFAFSVKWLMFMANVEGSECSSFIFIILFFNCS